MNPIRIGTRGSALALAQVRWVREKLEEKYPGLKIEVSTIKTSGDRFLDTPIKAIGGKGIFVKEIEEALLRNEIDLAVHSMKDLPAEIPAGLTIAAVPEREDPRDVLVSRGARTRLNDLSSGARIGTGSLRRKAQMLCHRADLRIVSIRGNIDTRLQKLDRGDVEALILARAGLRRLECESRITEYLGPEVCVSAVGQGALALECREGDAVVDKVLSLHHPHSALEVTAERAFLKRLGGGCHIPVGARAWLEENKMRILGVVADVDGSRLFKGEMRGSTENAQDLGLKLAERLLREGADKILMPGEQ